MNEIERALGATDWTANGADSARVSAAITHLLRARSRVEAQRAYNDVLDAIGHNHSGWLYDAAGPAAPLIAAIARNNQGWTRWAALEILIDFLAWVRPEQHFVDTSGRHGSVRGSLRDSVSDLRTLLQKLAADPAHDPTVTSAAELLSALDETDAL